MITLICTICFVISSKHVANLPVQVYRPTLSACLLTIVKEQAWWYFSPIQLRFYIFQLHFQDCEYASTHTNLYFKVNSFYYFFCLLKITFQFVRCIKTYERILGFINWRTYVIKCRLTSSILWDIRYGVYWSCVPMPSFLQYQRISYQGWWRRIPGSQKSLLSLISCYSVNFRRWTALLISYLSIT